MNTLNLAISIPYPTLEQLISFAGIWALASIGLMLWAAIAPAVLGMRSRQLKRVGFKLSIMAVNPIGFIVAAFTHEKAEWQVFFSSPLVVFYLSAWAGIV